MIGFLDVDIGYPGLTLYKGLNLTVSRGEVLCLLGPSGCGKTTLLNIAAGLIAPDRGVVRRPDRISYVFQEARLLPWETVWENTVYAMDPGNSKAEKNRKADEVLNLLELTDAAGKRPNEISGGMARRTALARALLAPHDAMLLDEPLASLDPDMRTRILPFLKNALRNKTTILVTHDYAVASALSDRILRLSLPPVRLDRVEKGSLESILEQIERIDRDRTGILTPGIPENR